MSAIAVWVVRLWKRFCKMFSRSSFCLHVQLQYSPMNVKIWIASVRRVIWPVGDPFAVYVLSLRGRGYMLTIQGHCEIISLGRWNITSHFPLRQGQWGCLGFRPNLLKWWVRSCRHPDSPRRRGRCCPRSPTELCKIDVFKISIKDQDHNPRSRSQFKI